MILHGGLLLVIMYQVEFSPKKRVIFGVAFKFRYLKVGSMSNCVLHVQFYVISMQVVGSMFELVKNNIEILNSSPQFSLLVWLRGNTKYRM